MTDTKRIAIYLRSATGNLADLKRQFMTVKKELVRRGFNPETSLIEVYRDTHQSGMRSGPEFERMIADVTWLRVARMHPLFRSGALALSRDWRGTIGLNFSQSFTSQPVINIDFVDNSRPTAHDAGLI